MSNVPSRTIKATIVLTATIETVTGEATKFIHGKLAAMLEKMERVYQMLKIRFNYQDTKA